MRSLHVFSIAGAIAIAVPGLAQAQRPGVYLPGQSGTAQNCSPMQVVRRQCIPANTHPSTVYPQSRYPVNPQQYPVYPQQYPVYPQQYPVYPQQYPVYPSYPQSATREVILPDGQRCMEHMDGTGRVHYNCPNGHANERSRRDEHVHGRDNYEWERHSDRRPTAQPRESRETHGRPGVYRGY